LKLKVKKKVKKEDEGLCLAIGKTIA